MIAAVSALKRLARIVIIADAIIFVVVALICFFMDWRSLAEYGDLLTKAGLFVLIFALICSFGGNSAQAEDLSAFSVSGAMRGSQALRQAASNKEVRLNFVLISILVAGTTIVAGYILLVMG